MRNLAIVLQVISAFHTTLIFFRNQVISIHYFKNCVEFLHRIHQYIQSQGDLAIQSPNNLRVTVIKMPGHQGPCVRIPQLKAPKVMVGSLFVSICSNDPAWCCSKVLRKWPEHERSVGRNTRFLNLFYIRESVKFHTHYFQFSEQT